MAVGNGQGLYSCESKDGSCSRSRPETPEENDGLAESAVHFQVTPTCYHVQRTSQGQSDELDLLCRTLSLPIPNRFIHPFSKPSGVLSSKRSPDGLRHSASSFMLGILLPIRPQS